MQAVYNVVMEFYDPGKPWKEDFVKFTIDFDEQGRVAAITYTPFPAGHKDALLERVRDVCQLELAAFLIVQADDLAVEYGILYAQTSQNFAQRTKTFVNIILSRDQLEAAVDQGKSTKAVVLQLENPIGVIEWSGCTRGNGEPDGRELLHDLILDGCTAMVQITSKDQFIAYPAAFQASTPPFSTLTFVKPCPWYFAA